MEEKLDVSMSDVLFRVIHYGCLMLGFTFIIGLVLFPIILYQAFGPDEESVIISQEIGGILICNSTYNADIHSWYYDVDYLYQDQEGNQYELGSVRYRNVDWPYNEQVILENDTFKLLVKENLEDLKIISHSIYD